MYKENDIPKLSAPHRSPLVKLHYGSSMLSEGQVLYLSLRRFKVLTVHALVPKAET